MNKENFRLYLQSNTKLKDNTVKRYVNFIQKLPTWFTDPRFNGMDLYNSTNTLYIDMILADPELIMRDSTGNRMYSSILRHYKKFTDNNINSNLSSELIIEDHQFNQYLSDNINGIIPTIEDAPADKLEYREVNHKKIWIRNPKFAREAIAIAEYKCEYNNSHEHFFSKYNGKNYVEAHHLIPIQYQDEFEYSLDTHANIVSLCVECHKKIHYGWFADKQNLLDELFSLRNTRLNNVGLEINLNTLYSLYKD
ncbi:hypothetical protein JCM19046_3069 [Bacillus sp. JCM 19046]|nr:hypothetical protein JCM19045_356 [Bacillus sp. JCM 19045]GAF18490.1 hypothetical protein JCM19046_3069 [Bacillus sp. JCM 19046]